MWKLIVKIMKNLKGIRTNYKEYQNRIRPKIYNKTKLKI